jgi:hypothetical protein
MMSSESRVFTVNVLVETAEGIIISHFDYQGEDRANDAMKKWHHECEYNRGAETVKYFCAYISNEWGGDEMRDSYTNPSFEAPEE